MYLTSDNEFWAVLQSLPMKPSIVCADWCDSMALAKPAVNIAKQS
jgi:hypothetical protein